MPEQLVNQNPLDTQSPSLIQDLFRVPDRYLRSIHIERDFNDVNLLKQYILTPPVERALERVTEGLRANSGQRAWRITGDYGSGKSSFALMLAHTLLNPEEQSVLAVRRTIEGVNPDLLNRKILPILVTGVRDGLVAAISRGILWALESFPNSSTSETFSLLKQNVTSIIENGNEDNLLSLIGNIANLTGYSGTLLVLDELGKFLEYAALYPEREDVYFLQRLAEMATRSGSQPIVLLGLLHQGFHAYAERLPTATRHEWEKVAGRFDEIVFDQPLIHTLTLVSSALDVCTEKLPEEITSTAGTVISGTLTTGWYGAAGGILSEQDLLKIYPLHPSVLPILIQFFSRFGQHERSLFSFILSSEPFGLQAFAERPLNLGGYYRLSNFYDYIRANFGHRLAGASFRSQWLRIVDILDSIQTDDEIELAVLKTVGVLNLIDAEQFLATDSALQSAICDESVKGVVAQAIQKLLVKGHLYYRGRSGGYRLWSKTSINLESRFEDAKRALGPVEQVAIHLPQFLNVPPLLARRHYIQTGTLRYFEVRYANLASLSEKVTKPTEADGLIVVALCDTRNEQNEALAFAQEPQVTNRSELLIAIPFPLMPLRNEVQDALCWKWVHDNAPELIDDTYAFAEVTHELASSERQLKNRVTALISFGSSEAGIEIKWWREGKRLEIAEGQGILQTLSEVCDDLFDKAPIIKNELLNRSVLSSAAATARMKLIEKMLTASHKPFLDIDQKKAPPEKSIYLSVLKAGAVHREEGGHFIIEEPTEDNDPLHLRPALLKVITMLQEAQEQRVGVTSLINALVSKPFGIRLGVIPLLLAIVIKGHSHELAVYENGTFLPDIGPFDFLRLIKAPTIFEFQMIDVAGVRLNLFNRLATVFTDYNLEQGEPELLDVVRSFVSFAKELPEYTRRSDILPPTAARVRNVLFDAKEPRPMLFKELPEACGFETFSVNEPQDSSRVEEFVALLQQALYDLRNAYPLLLERIRTKVARSLGEDGGVINRQNIANRASKVAVAATESRLRTFALRLADTNLNADSWAEALGSFVIAKPVRNWLPGDEKRANEEIEVLSSTFQRLEAITFSSIDSITSGSAVRVGLTHSNGIESMQVVQVRPEIELEIEHRVSELQELLPESEELRLAILVQLLERSLKKKETLTENFPLKEAPDSIAQGES